MGHGLYNGRPHKKDEKQHQQDKDGKTYCRLRLVIVRINESIFIIAPELLEYIFFYMHTFLISYVIELFFHLFQVADAARSTTQLREEFLEHIRPRPATGK